MSKRYIGFLRKYFPYYKIKKQTEISKLYDLIYDNSVVLHSLKRAINNDNSIYFTQLFTDAVQKLLIVIPLKDEDLVAYSMRLASDMAYKSIYSFQENDFSKVNNSSYRNMKDNFKSLNNCKNEIDEISTIFGLYSNEVHKKKIVTINLLSDLSSKLDGKPIDFKKLTRHLEKLIINFYSVLIIISNINYNEMNFQEKSRLDDIRTSNISTSIILKLKSNTV